MSWFSQACAVAAVIGRVGRRRHPVEQGDFRRLGEQRVPQLFGIAVGVQRRIGVDPAAAIIMVRADVAEIADDFVGLILLQQLVGDDRVARFGAGIEAVIHQRLLFQVETQALEVFVPVGELDDDLDVGVDLLCRPQHQGPGRDLTHFFQAVLRP